MEEKKKQQLDDMINEALSLIEKMRKIRVQNYPTNSINMLSLEYKSLYLSCKQRFEEICKKFDFEIRELPQEEQLQMYETHLPWKYQDMLTETEGMPEYSSSYDEFELPKFFMVTYNYGTKAVDDLIIAEYTNNQELRAKSLKTLGFCRDNFRKHFWGEAYSEDLKEYEERARKGITSSESILDSYNALLEIYDILKKTADLMLTGPESQEEYQKILAPIFQQKVQTYEALLNWIPREMHERIDLYSKKNNMLDDPASFINDYNLDTEEIHKKLNSQRANIIAEIAELDIDKEVDLSLLPTLSDDDLKEVVTGIRVQSRKKAVLNSQIKI